MQKVRSHPKKGSHCLYVHGFRIYFTPLTGVLFTFPSRYLFTIGRLRVFSLGGWSPHIQTGFHVSRPTHLSSMYAFQIRGYHPLWPFFPEHSIKHIKTFGLIRFRSPLLTESLRFLFLRVLRCFSSPGLLPPYDG